MLTITINNQTIQAKRGQTIIEVADEHDIYIPRFCYHPKLSVAANCRMCLVEVEKARKPMPACATPIADNMVISTQSLATKKSQQAVMEFLLINHPLDCPICDQGGQCELQDLAVGFGSGNSHYSHSKTSVANKNIGPLIATQMTRCIKCSRCVRYGDEIAGIRELGLIGRGENVTIDTYIDHFLQSNVSGNIIDICPVGALLSKPFLFKARPWELCENPSIAGHDCLGSHLSLHTRFGDIMRATPKECPSINEIWLSDRDRFSYLGINSEQRLTTPIIKTDQGWKELSWEEVIAKVSQDLQQISAVDASQLGVFASPSASVESLYLLQKLIRQLGCNNIDHRLRQNDFSNKAFSKPLGLEIPIEAIADQEVILLMGSNVSEEQPILAQQIRKATSKGAKVIVINPVDYNFNFSIDSKVIASPDHFITTIAKLLKALIREANDIDPDLSKQLDHIDVDEVAISIAKAIKEANKKLLLMGHFAVDHKKANTISQLVMAIASVTDAKLGFLTHGANSWGAIMSGAIPYQGYDGHPLVPQKTGLDVAQMLANKLPAYITLGVELELDSGYGEIALNALKQAEHVICLTAFDSKAMREYATIMLPITPYAEMSGTFINVCGNWQSFKTAAPPKGEARAAWKVIKFIANHLKLSNFDYLNHQDVLFEMKQKLKEKSLDKTKAVVDFKTMTLPIHYEHGYGLHAISFVPRYSTDSIVRRVKELQQLDQAYKTVVKINPETAKQRQLQAKQKVQITPIWGDNQQKHPMVTFILEIDPRIAKNCLLIPTGIEQTIILGKGFDYVDIMPIDTKIE